MANTKLTKKDYFLQLLELDSVKGNTALVDFINHELELLGKKNSADRKPTATQKENEELKVAILDSMEIGKSYSVTDLIKSSESLGELSNQRVSALLRQLKESGLVIRTEDKKKALFSKAE